MFQPRAGTAVCTAVSILRWIACLCMRLSCSLPRSTCDCVFITCMRVAHIHTHTEVRPKIRIRRYPPPSRPRRVLLIQSMDDLDSCVQTPTSTDVG